MLSLKVPIRITMSNSCPCAGHPKNPSMCLRVLSKHLLSSDLFGAVTRADSTATTTDVEQERMNQGSPEHCP